LLSVCFSKAMLVGIRGSVLLRRDDSIISGASPTSQSSGLTDAGPGFG
jgi:hypothetical protein